MFRRAVESAWHIKKMFFFFFHFFLLCFATHSTEWMTIFMIQYLDSWRYQDRTFGLKNKKGAKQQKFIQQVEKQVKPGVASGKALDPNAKKLEKEKKLKEQKELALLFKPVQSQKIEKGRDTVASIYTCICSMFLRFFFQSSNLAWPWKVSQTFMNFFCTLWNLYFFFFYFWKITRLPF